MPSMSNLQPLPPRPSSARFKLLVTILACSLIGCSSSQAKKPDATGKPPAIEERTLPNPDGSTVTASPKPGWGNFNVVEKDLSRPWWQQVLLWPVNRFLDVIDVVHVDAGIGFGFGGVLRVTKYGHVGYRSFSPGSIRLGFFGRDFPGMVETSNEFGIGPAYIHSKDREICKAEFGAALDLLVGLNVGICGDEVIDLIAGIFFLDTSDDDIR
jgi:hypothetical protein